MHCRGLEEHRQQQAADKGGCCRPALTFGKLAERYVTAHVEVNCKPRSAAEIARLLGRASHFFGDKYDQQG